MRIPAVRGARWSDLLSALLFAGVVFGALTVSIAAAMAFDGDPLEDWCGFGRLN